MNSTYAWRAILVIFMIGIGGCSTTGPAPVNPYFEMPPDRLLKPETDLYNRALEKLKNNHLDESIALWKRFLESSPRSFRGYNNLGMALYSHDRLEKAITAFETALALEPFDTKIKDNLKRALRFQVTILKENKEYDRAIQHLERVKKLTDLPGKEKVALDIEVLQDRIYEQVKETNTLENYEMFVAKYPDNPKFADEARRQIAKMKPQEAPLGNLPEMQGEMTMSGESPSEMEVMTPEPFIPEPMESVTAPSPAIKETIEIVAETEQPEELEEMSSGMKVDRPAEVTDLIMGETSKPEAMKMPKPAEPMVAPAPDPAMEMKREQSAPNKRRRIITKNNSPAQKATSTQRRRITTNGAPPPQVAVAPKQERKIAPARKTLSAKRVRINTKSSPLRVRENPKVGAKVVAQVPKGSVVPVFQETDKWFQIEYQKGKKGWISKKYSKIME